MVKWKDKEIRLNAFGIPSRRQVKKLKIIKSVQDLPAITKEISDTEYHKLSLAEFTSLFINGAIQESSVLFTNKTMKDVVQKISVRTLSENVDRATNTCERHYSELIKLALKEKRGGIQLETLRGIQFQSRYFKVVRSYCRHFDIDL